MKKNVAIVSFFLLWFSTLAWCQAAPAVAYSGTVERIKVHGKLLEGNLDGDSPDRDVSVYLPASYAKDKSRRYPVIYFLHGFTDSEDKWFRDPNHWINLPKVLNKAFGEPGSREMIVVMPNAFTKFEGSFYGSSVDTGDWDGFISQELVAYMDSHYRTLAQPASRGLAGHSMGGYGTVRIGMKHPEVFFSIYALSPCCMDNSNLQMNDGMKGAEAVTSPEQIHTASFWTKAMLATAAAWSPDPNGAPLYIDLPYKDAKLQPLVAAKWAANAPVSMLDQYIPNVKRLKAIAMDVGDRDGLAPGLKLFDQALTEYKISHFYEVYPGDHLNHIGDRIETKVVPFFSKSLAFE
jgi:enterochelin esterase-like enzyme